MRLLCFISVFSLVACSGSGSSTGSAPTPSGTGSATFTGAVSRTTQYGSEPNTGVYCARYKDGQIQISLMEKGENRKNYAWAKDGVFFTFYNSSLRPQDITQIDGGKATLTVVVKEFPEEGTFNLAGNCAFKATGDGGSLDIRFDCNMSRGPKTLNVFGWAKCNLKQMDF